MKKIAAIHFGAGNIGRGLISKIYQSNNIEIIFLDNNKELVEKLQQKKEYKINYENEKIETFNNFLIFSSIEELINSIENYEIKFISTSIGTKNFQFIKNDLEHIFYKLSNNKINIIAFENDFMASTILKTIMNDKNENHNYIDCLIDKIVPNFKMDRDSNLDIYTEKYFEVIFNNKNKKDDLISKNVKWTDDFEPFLYRKLWIINSTHLMLGYLFRENNNFLYEMQEKDFPKFKELNNILDTWFSNISLILNKEYNFDYSELEKYIEINKKRIFNKNIKDETKRLRRDPIKKLKENERVISLLNKFKKYNLNYEVLSKLIYEMLTFIENDDQQSKEIGELVKKEGIIKALVKFSNISEDFAKEILKNIK